MKYIPWVLFMSILLGGLYWCLRCVIQENLFGFEVGGIALVGLYFGAQELFKKLLA